MARAIAILFLAVGAGALRTPPNPADAVDAEGGEVYSAAVSGADKQEAAVPSRLLRRTAVEHGTGAQSGLVTVLGVTVNTSRKIKNNYTFNISGTVVQVDQMQARQIRNRVREENMKVGCPHGLGDFGCRSQADLDADAALKQIRERLAAKDPKRASLLRRARTAASRTRSAEQERKIQAVKKEQEERAEKFRLQTVQEDQERQAAAAAKREEEKAKRLEARGLLKAEEEKAAELAERKKQAAEMRKLDEQKARAAKQKARKLDERRARARARGQAKAMAQANKTSADASASGTAEEDGTAVTEA